MNYRAMIKTPRIIAHTLLALSLSLGLAACNSAEAPQEEAPLKGAAIGGSFALQDKDGKTVRWEDFDGKYRTVYFGYTFCPDACPMDMQILMKGFAQFEKEHPEAAAKVQPIFISIDPERDTPEVVGEFTAAFSPRLLGLTGSKDDIAATAKSFAAYYAKGEVAGSGYLMDHARAVYLMGPKGEPIALLPIDKGMQAGPEAVAAELAKWVK